ncbi:MAG: hypothetical protein AAB225_30890 [Acidobacteriota bacterium]
MTVTKRDLHQLVERLPDADVQTVYRMLLALSDPVLLSLLTAPFDDEPEAEDERAAVEEARQEIARGEGIPLEDIKRELGL